MPALGALVMVGVRMLRRPEVQQHLPERLRWARLSFLARVLVIFLSSLTASALASLAAGLTLKAALVAAVVAGLTAIAGHKATKGAGHALTARAVKGDPTYQPGALRRSIDLIAPLDQGLVRDAAVRKKVADAGGS